MKLKFICSTCGLCICLTACGMPNITKGVNKEDETVTEIVEEYLTEEEEADIFLNQVYAVYQEEIGETIPGERIVEKVATDFEWDFSVYEFDETGFVHKYYLITYYDDAYQYNCTNRLDNVKVARKSLMLDDANHTVSYSLDYVNMGSNAYEYFRKKIQDDFYAESVRLDVFDEDIIISEIINSQDKSTYTIVGDLTEYTKPIPELEVDDDGYILCLTDDEYWQYRENADETITITGYDCEWLGTKLVIPDKIDSKEVYSVAEMIPVKDITCVEISSGIKELVGAFKGWEDLNILQLNEGLLSISNSALEGTKVSSVLLPDSIMFVEDNFYEQLEVGDVDKLPQNMSVLGKMYSGSSITSILVPATVKEISENAFSGCDDLTVVFLSDGVEKIGAKAFYDCSVLQAVAVPMSVSVIEEDAFNINTMLVVPENSYAQQYAEMNNLAYAIQEVDNSIGEAE